MIGLHLCYLQPYSTILYYQVSICASSNPILQYCIIRSPSVLFPTYSTILYHQVSICATSNPILQYCIMRCSSVLPPPYSTLLYYQVSICATSNPILQYCIIGSPSVLPPTLFYNIALSGLHLCYLHPYSTILYYRVSICASSNPLCNIISLDLIILDYRPSQKNSTAREDLLRGIEHSRVPCNRYKLLYQLLLLIQLDLNIYW